MACLLVIIRPTSLDPIDYHQHALDDQGAAMVASAGLALSV